jgi:hypothetical protein
MAMKAAAVELNFSRLCFCDLSATDAFFSLAPASLVADTALPFF